MQSTILESPRSTTLTLIFTKILGNKYCEILAIATITILVMGAVLVSLPHPLFSGVSAGGTEFVIEKGESLGLIAHNLSDQNLISSRYLFVIYAIFTGQERNFKSGRYIVPARANIRGLVNIFAGGIAETEDMEITIPEGTNVADAGKILEKAGLVGEGEFLENGIEFEGFLFPDTYRFKQPEAGKNLSAKEIIQKTRRNFEAKTEDLFKDLDVQKIKEKIIIASVLEKEVKTEQDMRLVAGIIEKRLARNMPLEIDATVTYGVCYPKFLAGQYCDVALANIIDNLKIVTLYNTYVNKGLPAGPISNPGLVAIKAALNPEKSNYLYYLSAPDGTTIFSKTAVEHARARAKYLGK